MSHYLIVGVLVFAAIAVWFMPIGIFNKILGCASCAVVAYLFFNSAVKRN